MNNAMLSVIKHLIETYGDSFFDNLPRANALLLDFSQDMPRERIQVRNFIELNAYPALKNAGSEYPLIQSKITQNLIDTFCLERTAAIWTVRLFAAALGYESPEILNKPVVQVPESEQIVVADQRNLVGIGRSHLVAIASDGTVFAHGANEHFQCDVSTWRNIVAVAAGDLHTVGLRADGTVLATGQNTYDQCDVALFSGVASVYAFGHDTVCVRQDGTAAAVGRTALDLSHFSDIKTIAKYPEGIFGIRHDGTVIAAEDGKASSANSPELAWIQTLSDVEQIISTYVRGSIVLKRNGHIYKMGTPESYFANWQDIVSMVDITDYFAILRKDGTVRILPYDRNSTRLATEADRWKDIVAIYGKYKRLIGLTKSGELVSVCTDPDWLRRNGSLDFLASWSPIGSPL